MRNLMLCILLLSAYASAEVRFYGSLGSGIESGRFRWNGQSTTQTAVRDLDSYVETFAKFLFPDSRNLIKDFRLFLFQISTDSTQIPPP